jgi:hypothetical protein
MSGMAYSHSVQCSGIGGQSPQHAGTNENKNKVEQSGYSKVECSDARSAHQTSIQKAVGGHKDVISSRAEALAAKPALAGETEREHRGPNDLTTCRSIGAVQNSVC